MSSIQHCPRHPQAETRLRCSSCDAPICTDCAQEAAVGYRCPACSTPEGDARREPGRLPVAAAIRSSVVALAAAIAGGLVLALVLIGGFLFLVCSGAIGWAVARAARWAAEERSTPYVRAMALTAAAFAVAVGGAFAGVGTVPTGLTLLAYPAALYGGWIAVRGS